MAAPTVLSVTPNAGSPAGGDQVVTIKVDSTANLVPFAVKFGNIPSPIAAATDTTTIVADPPPGAGQVDVTVTNTDGTSAPNANAKYTYFTVPPVTVTNGCCFTPSYSNPTFLGRQFDRVVDLLCDFVRIDIQVDTIQGATYTGSPGTNNTFNWTTVDQVAQACIARGLKWLPMFGYYPKFMNGNSDDKTGPTRDPGNWYPDTANAAWHTVDYITRTYGDLLCGFEDGNEVNTTMFFHKIVNGRAVIDPAGYFTMHKGIYRAIKTGTIGGIVGQPIAQYTPYPSTRVLLGSMSAPANPNTDSEPRQWIKQVVTQDAVAFFDDAAIHAYCWEYGPTYPATWNVFQEAQDVRASLVSMGRPDALLWDTENGISCRPDPTGTDPNTGSHNGGFSGNAGHVPGPGQSVTDAREISYTLAGQRPTQIDTAWKAYQDKHNPSGTLQRWGGPRAWFAVESTNPSLHDPTSAGDPAWNTNYGPFEYSATHQGAEKKPANWPTDPSMRDAIRSLANSDTVPPTLTIVRPTTGTLTGTATFYLLTQDTVTPDKQLSLAVAVDGVTQTTATFTYASKGLARTPPFNYKWVADTTAFTNASHTFGFSSADGANNTATASTTLSVSNSAPTDNPPVIGALLPADGTQVSGTQPLTATITDDNDTTLAYVGWYEGAPEKGRGFGSNLLCVGEQTAPNTYEGDWATLSSANGDHEVHVVAIDSAGNLMVGP